MTYRGGRIDIDHRFDGQNPHRKRRHGEHQSRDRASDRRSDAHQRQISDATSSGIKIRTDIPSIHSHGGEMSYSVNLEVTIPERAPLLLRKRFGSTDVSGLRAAGEIITAQGSLAFRDSRGTQKIENQFGSITVADSIGDTTVQNANGSISVQHVEGNLNVINRFASVRVTGVTRDLTIQNANGSVGVQGVKGAAKITNSFAGVTVRDIAGSLDIHNQNGTVDVADIRGGAQIRKSFRHDAIRDIAAISRSRRRTDASRLARHGPRR